MRFEQVIIIGANKVACDCVNIVCKCMSDRQVLVLESSDDSLSMLYKICHKHQIFYTRLTDIFEITAILENWTDVKRTLIISANNRYIFKKPLISKNNVTIVNFHYALLPDYRGINIPSWVIYNGEKETGITWHYVTEEIDHGKIIVQKKIEINEESTAFDITREGMRLSGAAFSEFFPGIMEEEIEGTSVIYPENGKLYLSKDLPHGGRIYVDDPVDLIGRILRAYDYGGVEMLPKLLVVDGEKIWDVQGYNIERLDEPVKHQVREETSHITFMDGFIRIRIKI